MYLNNKEIINNKNYIQETSVGDFAYVTNKKNKLKSLLSRISNKLSANIALKKYPMTNESPMLTFTFDDISDTAAKIGADILDAENAKGTFFVTTSKIGEFMSHSTLANGDDLRRLHENGHEIALHTHKHLPIFAYSKQELRADISENKRILNDTIPHLNSENFCYPYGVTSFLHKFTLKSLVRSARSIKADLNYASIDPLYLNSYIIDADCIDPDMMTQLMQRAAKPKSWLIFTSHIIKDQRETLVTTPDMLKLALKLAKQLGFDIVTIDQGLNKLNIPNFKGKSHA
jgi:peptidoglycan/xylan/chitin deacetylase (PgdA/CDA1 family)